ncbi:cytochrome P450 [Mesorhizobium sp. ES1-1]|uniref:cytochrome P450 n=1 Tax=Mesorhizobium sp. ES1-1 TaxID=2876629 RepID=UPI001CCB630E|nr:cytochrome P450 [Mesorhizobium sp. ES1-1]MBZ9676395.1 cytochrome P450 [Mesorhizobium sp. ES1-1]
MQTSSAGEVRDSAWNSVRAGAFSGNADIHAMLDEMRSERPVWKSPWGDVYVTKYDLVSDCLADRRLSHVPPGGDVGLADSALLDWLIYREGSVHGALRRALQQPFMDNGMAALRAVAALAVEDLVVAPDLSGTVDVVAAFTRAIPERIICGLIGVPDKDMPLLRHWSASVSTILDSGFDDAFGKQPNAIDEMSAYFVDHLRGLLAHGRMPPLLGGLPALAETLGLTTAGRNIALLAFAGHETTVHLIGNMLFHLARHPALWSALRADRRLVPAAVAETLRLESPVQKICRWPLEPMSIGDCRFERNESIVLHVGAANRDPDQFADPSRFDLQRPGRQSLAFGRGAHVCIGRALAEMEGTMVLNAALDRWTSIEPVAAIWADNSSIRGLKTLTLRLVP